MNEEYTNPLENIEAEQSLIGACLFKTDAVLHVVDVVRDEHFALSLHAKIWRRLVERFNRNGQVSLASLSSDFTADDGLPAGYLAKLANLGIVVLNIRDLAETVVNLAEKRRMADMLQQALNTLTAEPEMNAAEASTALIQSLQNVGETQVSRKPIRESVATSAVFDQIRRDIKPYSTLIPKLDEAMGGGIYPGFSYGICARMKVGKTTMVGTISYNLRMQNVPHLFICGEMSSHEIEQRFLARELQVFPSAFRDREWRESTKFQSRIYAASESPDKQNIVFYDAPGITFAELKTVVSHCIRKYGIKGFILDYWQLVGGKNSKKSQTEHLDEVAQWIADFSRRNEIFAIVPAQMNQEGNVRFGEGIKLAFDQVYHLCKADERDDTAWMEMLSTRYTKWARMGDEHNPILKLNEKGPFFEQVGHQYETDKYYSAQVGTA